MASDPNAPVQERAPVDPVLEREYNLRIRHPERTAVYERFAADSAVLRRESPGFAALRYGESPNSVIDFFAAGGGGPRPLFVFLHGGYWRALDRGIFSFLARPWNARGVSVALPGYDLAPAVTVRQIAAQTRRAIEWLIERRDELAIDTTRIVIGGHSAGAHLGALAVNALETCRPLGLVGVSGVYDLLPLLRTTVNHDVHLDAAEARVLSPLWLEPRGGARHLCAVGGAETDGFRDQSRRYAATLREKGVAAEYLEAPARTHFDILDDLADPQAGLFKAAWSIMQPDPE